MGVLGGGKLQTMCLLAILASLPGFAAPKDVMPEVAEAARLYGPFAGPVAWEGTLDIEAADAITFAGPDRILVGTVSVTSRTGVPVHGPLLAIDAQTGRQLWSAPRPALSGGRFTLAPRGSLVAWMGQDDRSAEIQVLDAATGAKRWGTRAKAPAEALLLESQALLLAEGSLRAFELATGKLLWQHPLPAGLPTSTPLASLGTGHGLALVTAGNRLLAIRLTDGQRAWMLDYPETPAWLALPSGFAVWTPGSVALVDATEGRTRWEHRLPEARTCATVVAESGSLYLVSDGPAMADDALEALDEGSGKRRWSVPLKEEAAGAPAVVGGLVCLSCEGFLIAVRRTDGTQAFRTPYSPVFQAARPSAATLLGAPDQLVARGSSLIVWRERAGLQAFSLPRGAATWTQRPYSDAPEFISDGAALLLKVTRESLGAQQASHDLKMKALQAQQRNLQLQADQAKTQQGAYVATAFSMVGAAQTFREAMRQMAAQGLSQRFVLLAGAVLDRPGNAIQGRYFLDPFIAKGIGRGLTVVDLDRGLRSDFLYAPLVAPLLDYSVDLLAFTMDSSQTRIVAVGLGFDPTRHQPIEKWGFRLPRPSLFSFDLGRLRFEATNAMRGKATSAYEKTLVKALGEGPVALANAAAGGLTDAARALLDAGADPNSLYPSGGMTALHLAVFGGHLPVVELLVKRGADVHRLNVQGKNPLDLALMPVAGESPDLRARKQAIATLLKAAGARPTGAASTTRLTSPVEDLHQAILGNDAPAFLAALERGVSIEAIHEGETPLTRALRERRPQMAAELRRRGCSLTTPGAYGLTPLHYASMQANVELMGACLAAKADPNATSEQGITPLMTLVKPYMPFGGDPMLQAVELLLTHGADPNRRAAVLGKQTLLEVAKSMDERLAALLKKHGAR